MLQMEGGLVGRRSSERSGALMDEFRGHKGCQPGRIQKRQRYTSLGSRARMVVGVWLFREKEGVVSQKGRYLEGRSIR